MRFSYFSFGLILKRISSQILRYSQNLRFSYFSFGLNLKDFQPNFEVFVIFVLVEFSQDLPNNKIYLDFFAQKIEILLLFFGVNFFCNITRLVLLIVCPLCPSQTRACLFFHITFLLG